MQYHDGFHLVCADNLLTTAGIRELGKVLNGCSSLISLDLSGLGTTNVNGWS